MLHLNKLTFFTFCVYILLTFSCTHDNTNNQNQKELFELLEKEKTNYQSSFSIINAFLFIPTLFKNIELSLILLMCSHLSMLCFKRFSDYFCFYTCLDISTYFINFSSTLSFC